MMRTCATPPIAPRPCLRRRHPSRRDPSYRANAAGLNVTIRNTAGSVEFSRALGPAVQDTYVVSLDATPPPPPATTREH